MRSSGCVVALCLWLAGCGGPTAEMMVSDEAFEAEAFEGEAVTSGDAALSIATPHASTQNSARVSCRTSTCVPVRPSDRRVAEGFHFAARGRRAVADACMDEQETFFRSSDSCLATPLCYQLDELHCRNRATACKEVVGAPGRVAFWGQRFDPMLECLVPGPNEWTYTKEQYGSLQAAFAACQVGWNGCVDLDSNTPPPPPPPPMRLPPPATQNVCVLRNSCTCVAPTGGAAPGPAGSVCAPGAIWSAACRAYTTCSAPPVPTGCARFDGDFDGCLLQGSSCEWHACGGPAGACTPRGSDGCEVCGANAPASYGCQ